MWSKSSGFTISCTYHIDAAQIGKLLFRFSLTGEYWKPTDEGNSSRRRQWLTLVSPDEIHQQTAAARLRQAGDLLSAVGIDARRHPRNPDHQHATRSATYRRTIGRRRPTRTVP